MTCLQFYVILVTHWYSLCVSFSSPPDISDKTGPAIPPANHMIQEDPSLHRHFHSSRGRQHRRL
ncbi:hypothetical protein ARMGADRAFT_757920 [Armillaria gallica]|uniref:Secreted protein n=1 Tax=Armillaria gallica TaxID=47427 RepID=A0A2H3E698_ARMGA|nr:hypothetical protein ARMGADRAFT_757920 [Armillaria gallica]